MDFRVISFFVFEFVTLFVFTKALSPDGLALLDFKASISDTSSITRNWNVTDSSPCSWGGVTCAASGLVIGLNLSSQEISGVISPSLGKLQSLQILDLSFNFIVGSIPSELGNCSSLLELNLISNLINGTIPSSLGSVQTLKRMILGNNYLVGEIPFQLGNLGNLTYLDLDGNYLIGTMPQSFGNFLLMEEVFLDYNNLGGTIPEEFLALPKLQYVDLSYNSFDGLQSLAIFNNTNLIDMRINNNNLTGDISSGLQALSMNRAMYYFDCSGNKLHGTIPQTLGNMTSLFLFYIYDNIFTGSIPPSIGELTNLAWFHVGNNSLSGPLPSEFGQLQELLYFQGYNNMFSGPIPIEFGDCSKLQVLHLYENPFDEGAFPLSLTKLIDLQYLDLSQTSRIGNLPLEFYNLTLLNWFNIGWNNMTGSISPEIGNLQNLFFLGLGTNFFSGVIPNEIENCTNMIDLYLTTNNFHGALPSNYWNFKHLSLTTASLNPWTLGPFPKALAEFVNLTHVSFYGIPFNGSLPPSLGMVSPLSYLGVHGDSLSGPIPTGLCQNKLLSYLDLSDNQFEGAVPASLAQCTTLNTFWLNNNQLTILPIGFVTNLTSIVYFDLSFNLFEGTLPIDFGANASLQTLYLNNNNFSGDLSSFEFGQLPNLVGLNLSTNTLRGSIPTSIASCANLAELDLSINNLRGSISPLINLTELQSLYLQGNKFFGLDALVFTTLTKLAYLDLSSNQWNISIPLEMGGLLDLQLLNMSYGQLSGSIPLSFATLRNLEVLDLSHNELEGNIPIELGNLLSLSSVNISFNNLTGSLPPNWVKFLNMDHDDFVGNPRLCQNYSSISLQCTIVLPSKVDDISISNHMIMVIVICTSLIFLMVFGLFGWWYFFLRKRFQRQLGEVPIFFTTMVGEEIRFSDVMDATENMSNNCLLKKNLHGAVYKGLLKSKREIILKTIEIADGDTQSIQSYLAEIELLQNIKHRNIVKLLGFCRWGDIGFILYDYIPNGDLDNALHNVKTSIELDWPTRLCIAKGVAHGIAYLHHDCISPIIHRDIKASNVLLDKDLEPILTDFGIAKEIATKTKDGNMESTTVVAGTYGYMAPEYISGGKISMKVDVYSYGVLLLELLTGKRPIEKSFGNFLHIVLFVQEALQQNGFSLGDIIDPILFIGASKHEQSQMLEVLNVALFCTKDNPLERPSSKQIKDMLQRCCPSEDLLLENGKELEKENTIDVHDSDDVKKEVIISVKEI